MPYGTAQKKFSAGDLVLEIIIIRMIHVGDAGRNGIEDFESADEAVGRVDRNLETPVRHCGNRLRQSPARYCPTRATSRASW